MRRDSPYVTSPRAVAAAVAVSLARAGVGCDLPSGEKDACREDADCNAGRVCVEGRCADTRAPGADAGGIDTGAETSGVPSLVAGCAGADFAIAGDVDGDGRSDIACHVTAAAETRVLSLAKDGSRFVVRAWQKGFCGPGGTLHVADVDGDGRADLVCHEPDLSRTSVALSTPSGAAPSASWNPLWCGAARFLVGDVDGDKRADCVCHETDTLLTSVALATPPTFTPQGVWLQDFCAPPGVLSLADVDGDGHADAACGGASTPFRVATAAAGRFAAPRDLGAASCAGDASFADVNGDGKADAICHDAARGTISAALGTGATLLDPRSVDHAGCAQGARAVAGDFDGDKRQEVACVRDPESTIVVVSWGTGPAVANAVGIAME